MASEKKPPTSGLRYGKDWRDLVVDAITDPQARAVAEQHEQLCRAAEAKRQELKAELNRIGRAKGVITGSESYVLSRNSKLKTTYNIRTGSEKDTLPSDF